MTTNFSESSTIRLLIVLIIILVLGLFLCMFYLVQLNSSKLNDKTTNEKPTELINNGTGSSTDSNSYQDDTTNTLEGNTDIELNDQTDMKLSSQNYYVDITNLDIIDGSILQMRIENNIGVTLETGKEFTYDPYEVRVDSEGNASILYTTGSIYYKEGETPLYLVLFEIYPDSSGTPHAFELIRQKIKTN